mmetsp:Transcript_11859/g.25462  ORF Transcript_11859/g.25462 Transcript_11859/m.25462 type:complete len:348 (+) Transcript_11859:1680-2723(+)
MDDAHGLDLLLLLFCGAGQVAAQPLGPAVVDDLNDLHVTWQHLGHHLDGPLLQGLGHHRVVGVVQYLGGDGPGLVPRQALHIHQQAHHLSHSNGGVSVIQLEAGLLGQQIPLRAVPGLEAGKHVLQGGAHKEVLLLQAQLLALWRGVIGVQHCTDGLSLLALHHSLVIVASIESTQVKLSYGQGIPQAQVGGGGSFKARDGVVVGLSNDPLIRAPHSHLLVALLLLLGLAAKHDLELDFRPLYLIWVALSQPDIRKLLLVAVVQGLFKHAVLVTDAITPAWKVKSSHGVKEAGSQTAKATVSESSIALLLLNSLHVIAQLVQCLCVVTAKSQIKHCVGQGTSHKKLR